MHNDNVNPAPARVAALRIVCAGCEKVLRQGVPGAATAFGSCTRCRLVAYAAWSRN